MVFARITVFVVAEDVATVITVITYYYCLYHLQVSYAAEKCYCTAVVGYCGGTAVMEVLLRSLYGSTAVMAV